jgi:branched-subunit amino acid aminotransferase/4-amino-4-deoxychorismate lyase
MHACHQQQIHACAGELLDCLKELLRVDRRWLPDREGYALYVRPFMFSSSHSLGVGRPERSTLAIMLSPVGPYFATGARAPPCAAAGCALAPMHAFLH